LPGGRRGRVNPPNFMKTAWIQTAAGDIAGVGNRLLFGRARDNDLVLPEACVSRRHGAIVADASAGGYAVADFESRNGTFVNGRRVPGRKAIRHGDRLRVGDFQFRFLLA